MYPLSIRGITCKICSRVFEAKLVLAFSYGDISSVLANAGNIKNDTIKDKSIKKTFFIYILRLIMVIYQQFFSSRHSKTAYDECS